MKDGKLQALVVLLCALQVATLAQLHGLKREMQQMRNDLSGEIGSVQSELRHELQEVLQAQENPLLDAACEVAGTPDTEQLTVPVAYRVTPKELATDTTVTLVFGAERVPMQREEGGRFSVTAQRPLFMWQEPLLELTTGGLTRQARTQNLALLPWMEALPTLRGALHGGEGRRDEDSLQRSGLIDLDADSVQGLQAVNLVVYADEQEVHRERVSPDGAWDELALMYDLDLDLQLPGDRQVVMVLEALDEYGFLHRRVIDYWEPLPPAGSTPEFLWLGEELIYAHDGTLLYGPQYETDN